jgi:glycosyltransferase involved in cell wall biosynthesis
MTATEVGTDTVALTVVVPTRNEAGNVAALVHRLDRALGDTPADIVFVDDSTDDTPERIREVAEASARRVRLVHRAEGERVGGLGTAVLTGLRAANSPWAVVMDGDLQHPPELVPELVAHGDREDADVVVASRYVGDGSASGLSSFARVWVSGSATKLAKLAFPRRLAGCTDPMSGFFAVRTARLDLERMHPNGFKILLEILARSPRLRIGERPFTFGTRLAGESKASWREGMIFVRRLMSLRLATLFGRHSAALARLIAFAAVGLSGIVINSAALWAFVHEMGAAVLLGATLATQVSTTWNFLLTDRLVFRGQKARGSAHRFFGFALVNNATLLARLPLLAWLVHVGVGYLTANVLTLMAAFAIRFVLSDRYLFVRGDSMTSTARRNDEVVADLEEVGEPAAAQTGRVGPVHLVIDLRAVDKVPVRPLSDAMPGRYDIHGIVSIASAVPLRELACFAADVERPRYDIEIRPGVVAPGRSRARTRVTQYASLPAVSYEEHLGRFGSDFCVDMTDGIQVFVGPWLVRSPHVLYTNVVEALLRFVLVSRGYMLLHSACLDLDGHGLLMSALTDTGKTGTVLRLLRENESRFLSDDMTILDPEGIALSYSKPLTISQHTLRAVQAGDLSPKEWRRLRVQSRLHSKQGRGIGARMGEMNLPIMSLNALTQFVVPPPKYVVDRLVPCTHGTSVRIEDLFIIERDEYRLADIDPELLLDELIANTDDAYGFPPFRYFAPALVVGGMSYDELRAEERRILQSAMRGVRARRLATPDYTWADHIPGLLRAGSAPNVVPLRPAVPHPTPLES